MNALSLPEVARLREHLRDCPECQQELTELREVAAMLGKVPAQAFLDGPPENPELLTRGTLRLIRSPEVPAPIPEPLPVPATTRENRVRIRTLRPGWPQLRDLAVAAALVVLAVLAGGLIGRSTAPSGPAAIAGPPTPSATATVVAGTVQATSTDPKTGARLTAQIVPAQGWVRVIAATAGIKSGQRCTLYLVSRSGQRVQAGSWLVSPAGAAQGTTLQGSALIPPAQVAAVQVENAAGDIIVRTEI